MRESILAIDGVTNTAGDYSNLTVLRAPAILTGLMMAAAGIAAGLAHVEVRQLFLPYLSGSIAISILAILFFVFLEFAKLARAGAQRPVTTVRQKFAKRAALMSLPALILPLFLIGYTASKTAIPFLVGYTWDSFWADADRLIFGDDVWRLSRSVLGTSHAKLWQWFYTVGWGGVFFITANAIALFANRRTVGTYFTAMLATWFIGGCLMAYGFSAAGPIFAPLFDPRLNEQFQPLRETLQRSLGGGPIAFTQHYLASIRQIHVAVKGGGISAMPSMHLAAATIYVLASRGTKWLAPSMAFWLIIFIASGYFGYHYWIDGIVAAIVAWTCWAASARYYRAASSTVRLGLGDTNIDDSDVVGMNTLPLPR